MAAYAGVCEIMMWAPALTSGIAGSDLVGFEYVAGQGNSLELQIDMAAQGMELGARWRWQIDGRVGH